MATTYFFGEESDWGHTTAYTREALVARFGDTIRRSATCRLVEVADHDPEWMSPRDAVAADCLPDGALVMPRVKPAMRAMSQDEIRSLVGR